ncbi:adenylate cyclase type 5-like protein, partial [Lasius niger]
MNEIWLAGVSGAILVTLLALQVTLSIHLARLHEASRDNADDSSPFSKPEDPRTGGPLAAALAVCFFIYMAYALLPIRLRHACIAGIVFSAAHLIGVFLLYPDYPSMIAH